MEMQTKSSMLSQLISQLIKDKCLIQSTIVKEQEKFINITDALCGDVFSNEKLKLGLINMFSQELYIAETNRS